MSNDYMEQRIKRHLAEESAKGDLSSGEWNAVLAHLRNHSERRWWWRLPSPLRAQPVLTMALSLAVVLVTGGAAVWASAPWGTGEAGAPVPTGSPAPAATGTPAVAAPVPTGTPAPVGTPVPGGTLAPGATPHRGSLGGPAPTHFDQSWSANQTLISPGDPVTITLTLENIWDQRIEFTDFPVAVRINDVDVPSREEVPVPLAVEPAAPDVLEPGEQITLTAEVTPDLTAGLAPGRYNVGVDVRFMHTPGEPKHGETTLGLNSPVLFVVQPPEGALERTVAVGETQRVDDIRVTLDRIEFTPEETTIYALAELLGEVGPVLEPTVVPTPTPSRESEATPTPTAAPGPPNTPRSLSRLTAQYRVDGGTWRELRGHGYRPGMDNALHRWTLGPISANATTIEIVVSSENNDARWEWTVPLQQER